MMVFFYFGAKNKGGDIFLDVKCPGGSLLDLVQNWIFEVGFKYLCWTFFFSLIVFI